MTESHDVIVTEDTHTERTPARRGPELLTLLMGLICLATSVLAFVGWMPGIPVFDPRWLLAGGAIVVGLLLLATSLRRPSRERSRF